MHPSRIRRQRARLFLVQSRSLPTQRIDLNLSQTMLLWKAIASFFALVGVDAASVPQGVHSLAWRFEKCMNPYSLMADWNRHKFSSRFHFPGVLHNFPSFCNSCWFKRHHKWEAHTHFIHYQHMHNYKRQHGQTYKYEHS